MSKERGITEGNITCTNIFLFNQSQAKEKTS